MLDFSTPFISLFTKIGKQIVAQTASDVKRVYKNKKTLFETMFFYDLDFNKHVKVAVAI